MKRTFWLALVAAFVLVNEYLATWLLAMSLGNMDAVAAYERTFRHANFTSYFFAAAFRAIPFIGLALFAANSKLNLTALGRIALWCMLVALAALHFYGYWEMHHSLFTPARTSSTAALAVIAIPIWAMIVTSLGYVVCYFGFKAVRSFGSRD